MGPISALEGRTGVRRTGAGLGLSILLGCCSATPVLAQGFERVYGGAGMEFGYSVRQCADGGYVLLGSTESFGTGDRDIYLVRTDVNGDTLWTRTYGEEGFDSGWEVEPTADGGFIFCALKDLHALVAKVDAQGEVDWMSEMPHQTMAIEQTDDGEYIAAGMAFMGPDDYDMYVIRLTATGAPVWTRTYGTYFGSTALSDQAADICSTSDGGFVLYGSGGYSYDLGIPSDYYLVKINGEGDTLWTRQYSGAGFDNGYSVEETDDAGLILLGATTSFGGNMYEVTKTNGVGSVEWSSTLDGEGGADEGYEIRQTADGGYAFAGRIVDEQTEMSSVYLVKMDALGDTNWTRTFREGQGTGIELTADGGYAVVGFTASIGAGLNDLYLLKTDANGMFVGQAEPEAHDLAQASVFPDPVTDRTAIRFPNPRRAEVSFLLFNALGQSVQEIQCGPTDRIVWDRQGLPSGQYHFLISDGPKHLARGRLILE